MEPKLTIEDRIRILRTKIAVERDSAKKQDLNNKVQELLLKKEIESIKKRMEQLK